MIRIGVIVAHNSLQDVLFLKEKFQGRCEITVFTYKKVAEIKPLYQANHLLFDAIVLNWLANMVLRNSNVPYRVPTYYYVANERDFYKKLFYISRKYPTLNFSKVTFDFEKFIDRIDFEDLEEVENIYKKNFESHVTNLENFYEDILQRHLDLYNSSEVELSITAFSNLVDTLSRQGVKVELITASQKTIQELFERVILEVQNKQLLDSHVVVGKITSEALVPSKTENDNVEFNQSLLHTLLLEYTKKNYLTMIIQNHSFYFEIFTSQKELQMITNNFEHDYLGETLTENLKFEINIGWGIDQTIDEARKKAHLANHEAQQQAKPSLIITENNQLVPLNADEATVKMADESPELHSLSEKLDVSVLLIQKVMAVMNSMNTNVLSSADIASHLGITIRSSNRILNELESKGIAELTYKKHEKLRGRPKKFYKIQLYQTEL